MSDKKEMPASGGGISKGMPDGVSRSPATGGVEGVQGRSTGGESAGGAYPNPHTGKEETSSTFFGHGGQSVIGYHGSENPNATTKPLSSDDEQGGADKTATEARGGSTPGVTRVVLVVGTLLVIMLFTIIVLVGRS
jgi:hypothetical protein